MGHQSSPQHWLNICRGGERKITDNFSVYVCRYAPTIDKYVGGDEYVRGGGGNAQKGRGGVSKNYDWFFGNEDMEEIYIWRGIYIYIYTYTYTYIEALKIKYTWI